MANTLDFIRQRMEGRVEPTAQDKGLKLTIDVVCYDNGHVSVNGSTVGDSPRAYLHAIRIIAEMLEELGKLTDKHRDKETS
jgi:hypothetical protein